MAADTSTQSLGELLRQEREKRGLTIEQVASATKISVRLLHALEADHYTELPAKPFVLGFVSSYARFIGLNPKEVLTRYDAFLSQRTLDRPTREGGHSGYAFDKQDGHQSRSVLWAVIGSFAAIGGVVFVILKPSLHQHKGAPAEKLRAVQHGKPSPGVSQSPDASPSNGPLSPIVVSSTSPMTISTPESIARSASIPETAPSSAPSEAPKKEDQLNTGSDLESGEVKQRITFHALSDVWVRYQVDDKPITQFIFRKGKSLVLRGHSLIKFQVSNPRGVDFRYNKLGSRRPHEEKHLTMRQDTPTLIFPFELTETIQDPFPGEAPLPPSPPRSPRGAFTPTPDST